MNVTISVPGRFHLFNLAQQLLKRSYLKQLITSYPKFEVSKYGIPTNKVSSIVIKEILFRGWQKLPRVVQEAYNPQYFIHHLFDILARQALQETDIIVGSSSSFLETLRRAKRFGAKTIVERGSSHITYQNFVLKEEYERSGIPIKSFQVPHPKIIEQELCEYEEADYIGIPSSFVRKTFLERGVPESKLIQVPYGVDLSQFRQLPKEDAIFRIVFAGTMTIRKGVHYLLRAFSELNLPHAELLLIGSLSSEVNELFKKYEGAFRWIGRIPQSELHKYYSQGSVFAMMSVEEGLAMVIPQAMACGLPVIATTNTGAEDIVENGKQGFIIPIRDIDALKEKILYFYEHRDKIEEMGRCAKERVSTGFTWDDYGDKIIAAYGKIFKS
ncbi:MAG: Glycosyl transferase group 1 [Parcubacteria group bacterium GW2011_GWB1_46_8]|nr:MAG: Glycosyl transferase group 1 [Parcubacteria group bacterium GW2011_GWF1_45_5]KKU44205.1 MAG: Glycosyl transferase group 1 [Parcubacteria group bacterium GW2011_GWA2_46_7]KKU46628.1 MAG: Glycosyl transferase group 1 [Parcubacteria group bacterium GW2011_GWB1_46_8]